MPMKILNIDNPYQAPIYFVEQCDSTQIVARNIIAEKPLTGTVIVTNYQDKGRGRGTNRLWKAQAGESLLFTILFRCESLTAIPKAFPLRIGLAVAEAIADFVPALEKHISVKWPNDVMIDSRKVCGILAENDGTYILAGIGINVNQQEFPPEINKKAVSIQQAYHDLCGGDVFTFDNYLLLEKILPCAKKYLSLTMDDEWNVLLQKRLYKRGEKISFIPGQADSHEKIGGLLHGIGQNGELLIQTETEIHSYITGELAYDSSVF
jgi:BirA family biotin operon repressor/biotin-[acetyl-CoA-carboxylase] ligase